MSNELVPTDNNSVGYDIITKGDINPFLRSPLNDMDLYFYQTKETLLDPELYKSFLKNAENRFRASKEYKTYKAFLMSKGFTHCQYYGNIEADDTVSVELHHNILTLFDDCILICEHVLNTVGYISSFDLIQILINEHNANRIPCTFLSVTAHEYITNDPDSYLPPNMVIGKWWELISKYKYGITYEIAQKVIKYINKYNADMPVSINLEQQEQILNYAYYNQYGVDADQCKIVSTNNIRPEDKNYEW